MGAGMIDESQFLRDVSKHKMEIIRDDGIYRHVRFKKPESGDMYFDLITWPGYLCYTGDMGSYVFSRVTDMFQFFRNDRGYNPGQGRKLYINTGYWAEKVEAQDKGDGVTEFSEERFERAVIGDLVGWLKSHRYKTTKDERRELWEAVKDEVLDADSDSGGHRKQIAAYEFHYQVNDRLAFCLQDFWDHQFTEYSFRFVWCCYALAWGIQQYDEAKQTTGEPA